MPSLGKLGPAPKKLSVSPKPKFPAGTRPINVYGPNINKHPQLLGGGSSTATPRIYGKKQGKGPGGEPGGEPDFNPFGGL